MILSQVPTCITYIYIDSVSTFSWRNYHPIGISTKEHHGEIGWVNVLQGIFLFGFSAAIIFLSLIPLSFPLKIKAFHLFYCFLLQLFYVLKRKSCARMCVLFFKTGLGSGDSCKLDPFLLFTSVEFLYSHILRSLYKMIPNGIYKNLAYRQKLLPIFTIILVTCTFTEN